MVKQRQRHWRRMRSGLREMPHRLTGQPRAVLWRARPSTAASTLGPMQATGTGPSPAGMDGDKDKDDDVDCVEKTA